MLYLHLVIHGRVQGVGYRAWLAAEARRRHLEGWVRNRLDGTVEAVIGGDEKSVEAMTEACREGPLAARVGNIIIHPGTAAEAGKRTPGERFSVLPTR